MKLSILLLLTSVSAFVPSVVWKSSYGLHSTTDLLDVDLAVQTARANLLQTTKRLKQANGVLVVDSSAKKELKNAVEALENLSEPPVLSESLDEFVGDWVLLSTTATSVDGVDTAKFPVPDPIRKIRESVVEAANKYLEVKQRIRASGSSVDRIDHVLEYKPPDQLRDLLDNLPTQLNTININPLNVRKSSLCLIHKADVVDDTKTKIALTAVVLNVAGESKMLSADGADIAGINLPLGEFINTGTFETTFMDDELRVSRGKQGLVDQLRVFVRADRVAKDKAMAEIVDKEIETETFVGMGVDSEMDVDDIDVEEFEDESPDETEVVDDIGEEDEL